MLKKTHLDIIIAGRTQQAYVKPGVPGSDKQQPYKYPVCSYRYPKKPVACKLILSSVVSSKKNMGGYKHSLSI